MNHDHRAPDDEHDDLDVHHHDHDGPDHDDVDDDHPGGNHDDYAVSGARRATYVRLR
jgi:hypothetical protein